MKLDSIWWRIWIIGLVLKLMVSAWLPLTPDETYYWIWSKHLQLSYYDHPPMVAWLFWVGDFLPLQLVRWPAILLGQVGLWFWAKFLCPHMTPTQRHWWIALVLLMPLVGPGSLIITPDVPLLFSWGFCLWSFQRFLNQRSLSSAALLGMALGLGALSKYHAVLILPVLVYWWWTSPNRPRLETWLPVAAGIAFLVSTPVWLWNFQNDWASIRFQLHHGLGRPEWKPLWTRDYILGQIGLLFPTILWFAFKGKSAPRVLKVAAFFPLAFFLATSFRAYVEANWPVVAHPAILALAVITAPKKNFYLPAFIWIVGLITVLGLYAMPKLPEKIARTKLGELRNYDHLSQATREYSPLFAPSYQLASLLSFRQRRDVPKLNGMNRRDFYDSLPISVPHSDMIFIVMRATDELPEPWKLWRKAKVIPIDSGYEVWELHRP